MCHPIIALSLALVLAPSGFAAGPETPLSDAGPLTHRIYSHLLQPDEHPDYNRRAVKPPTWDTFQHRTQFTCLRGFKVQDERIVGFRQELDKFTRTHELGDVIWPSYPILFTKNLAELAAEIKRRDLLPVRRLGLCARFWPWRLLAAVHAAGTGLGRTGKDPR